MEKKRNLTEFAKAPEKIAVEIRGGMKSMLLARSIKAELDNGAALEDILFRRVPALDSQVIQDDAQQLLEGIQSVHDAAKQEVNAEWVKQRLNGALSKLDNGQRVTYLKGMISSVTTAYPEIRLNDEDSRICEAIEAAEEYTDEDVSTLLKIAGPLLPQFGELLQRSSAKAVIDRMHKIDHGKVSSQLDSGANAVTAYAAACYVMQKCGQPLKVKGQLDSRMPAFSVGAAAAASVESSKLMELYSIGKITMAELADRLKQMYTSVITYACEGVVHIMALAAYSLVAIDCAVILYSIFVALGANLYFSPFWLIVGSSVLAASVMEGVFTVKDFEDMIQGVWGLLKGLWSKIESVWHAHVGTARMEEAAGEDEAGYEVEEVKEDEPDEMEEDAEEEDEYEKDNALEGSFA